MEAVTVAITVTPALSRTGCRKVHENGSILYRAVELFKPQGAGG